MLLLFGDRDRLVYIMPDQVVEGKVRTMGETQSHPLLQREGFVAN